MITMRGGSYYQSGFNEEEEEVENFQDGGPPLNPFNFEKKTPSFSPFDILGGPQQFRRKFSFTQRYNFILFCLM